MRVKVYRPFVCVRAGSSCEMLGNRQAGRSCDHLLGPQPLLSKAEGPWVSPVGPARAELFNLCALGRVEMIRLGRRPVAWLISCLETERWRPDHRQPCDPPGML